MVEHMRKAMISSVGSHRKDALQKYMPQASSTSADPPILDGRIRPISDDLPKGTYKFIDARQWSTLQWPTR